MASKQCVLLSSFALLCLKLCISHRVLVDLTRKVEPNDDLKGGAPWSFQASSESSSGYGSGSRSETSGMGQVSVISTDFEPTVSCVYEPCPIIYVPVPIPVIEPIPGDCGFEPCPEPDPIIPGYCEFEPCPGPLFEPDPIIPGYCEFEPCPEPFPTPIDHLGAEPCPPDHQLDANEPVNYAPTKITEPVLDESVYPKLNN